MESSKEWAVGMSKEEFAIEFPKRYPHAQGIIPDMNKWLGVVKKEDTAIKPFNEEMIVQDHFTKKKRIEKNEESGSYTVRCAGCEQEYIKETEKKAKAALRMHERHCKGLLDKR